jgi:hypothetical protein
MFSSDSKHAATAIDKNKCWVEAYPLESAALEAAYQALTKEYPGLLVRGKGFGMTPFYGFAEPQASAMIEKLKEFLPIKLTGANLDYGVCSSAIIVHFERSDKAVEMFAALQSISGAAKHTLHQVGDRREFSAAITLAKLNPDSAEFLAFKSSKPDQKNDMELQNEFLRTKIVNLKNKLNVIEINFTTGKAYKELRGLIGETHPDAPSVSPKMRK